MKRKMIPDACLLSFTYLDMGTYYILVYHSKNRYMANHHKTALSTCAHVSDFRLHM